MSAPVVPDTQPQQIAEGVYVIPDQRIDLVPNVGFVVGRDAVLVVDTGMGIANAERVLERARGLAEGKPLYLTLTHFHPEHGFGAQVFRDAATIIYNESQREELNAKFAEFVEMFSGFSPAIADILSDVERTEPHETYETRHRIDLGGSVVELESVGPAHTRGDQLVWLPEQRLLFAGDLVENRFFPILPDADAYGSEWITLLERLEGMGPATVVPGHGAVGDAGLIQEVREYLVWIRSLVQEGQGKELEELKAELEPRVLERYSDWDNPMWIGFAIENFRGELDGSEPSK
jgi:glyoxylase-like metal-dependent hydrolase (beta-lactamase superfamily II)